MWGPGATSCIIRFICHIPTGMMGFEGYDYYQSVKDYGEIYDSIPNGWIFLQGMKTVGMAGIATFVWNFIQFGASPFCKGSMLGTVGLVDLTLAIALISGVVAQHRFLPGTFGGCSDAVDWRNGTDGQNFFVYANTSGTFDDSPGDICYDLVQVWAVTIAVIILYLFCATVNILIGFGATFAGEGGTITSFGSPPQYDCDMFPCYWVFAPFIWVLKPLLASCWFLYRALVKAVAGIKVSVVTKTRHHSKKRQRPLQPGEEKENFGLGSPPVLPFDIQVLIAKEAHYADLINLSRSSKKLRASFFGSEPVPNVIKSLRQYTCEGATKFECEVCDIQTCEACQTTILHPDAESAKHLTSCRPYCSTCYFTTFCRLGSWRAMRRARHDLSCSLHHTRYPAELAMSGIAGASRRVCRLCARRPMAEITNHLEGRGRRELDWLAGRGLTCGSCTEPIEGWGPRWWVCTSCSRECPDGMHPQWATRAK